MDTADEKEFTSETAMRTLQDACAIARLDGHGARLLRLGTNANYRLAAHPIMVRIAPGHIEDVRKEVNVARWLAGSGFPAARVVDDIDQPLILGERAVTFWELIEESPEPARIADVAWLIRDLHRLSEPHAFALPRFEPLAHTAMSRSRSQRTRSPVSMRPACGPARWSPRSSPPVSSGRQRNGAKSAQQKVLILPDPERG